MNRDLSRSWFASVVPNECPRPGTARLADSMQSGPDAEAGTLSRACDLSAEERTRRRNCVRIVSRLAVDSIEPSTIPSLAGAGRDVELRYAERRTRRSERLRNHTRAASLVSPGGRELYSKSDRADIHVGEFRRCGRFGTGDRS